MRAGPGHPAGAPPPKPSGRSEALKTMNPIVNLGIPAVGVFLMLVVGLELTPEDFRRVAVYPRAVVGGILAQIGLLVPGAALIVLAVDPSADLAGGLLLVASAPGAAVANYYTYLARANTALAVTLTAISNMGAVVTMPLLGAAGFAWCLGQRVDVQVPFLRTAGTLFFLVLLPIALGMALRRRRPALVQQHATALRRISLGAVGVLVGVILYTRRPFSPAGSDRRSCWPRSSPSWPCP